MSEILETSDQFWPLAAAAALMVCFCIEKTSNQTLGNYMLCCKQELVSQSGFYWEKQNYKEVNMWVALDIPVWKTIS